MSKRKFSSNIAGRVKKFKGSDIFVPLYEAVSNSIHALEDRKNTSPIIQIEIVRNAKQLDLDSSTTRPISGFIITDNGCGFDSRNLESFCEADSTYKAAKGGKGIGRFTWLRFFEKCSVESVYEENGKTYKRTFDFTPSGVEDDDPKETKAFHLTKVSLENLLPEFEAKARKETEDVVIAIVEHFITYLVTDKLPQMTIVEGSLKVDIQDFFAKNIKKNFRQNTFTVNGNKFNTTSIKFYLGKSYNTAFLCGNKRVADKIFLGSYDHFFNKRFHDEDLKYYAYHIYVESPYLDLIIHDDREGFRFQELGSSDPNNKLVSKDELIAGVLSIAQQESKEKIESLKIENLSTVKNFIGTQGPQYRHLLKKHEEVLSKIHDIEPMKIDTALRRIQFEEEIQTRAEVAKLLEVEHVDADKNEGWREKTKVIFEKLNESGKSNLAQYIVQRRYILEVLKKTLEVSNDQFAKEDAIHQLIFPMKTTSDEVNYENQNLWIIDERLAYHYYLASDKPLSTVSHEDIDSRKEPDILVFNRPIALNDRQEHEAVESIVVVEFKRPGHSPVKGEKDPVRQVLEYIDLIKTGKATSRTRRVIKPNDNTYYFGYVICEIDEALRKALVSTPMEPTPDGRGYFGFFKNVNTYMEVISYDKMLDDAWKRNRILFDKVHMPSVTI